MVDGPPRVKLESSRESSPPSRGTSFSDGDAAAAAALRNIASSATATAGPTAFKTETGVACRLSIFASSSGGGDVDTSSSSNGVFGGRQSNRAFVTETETESSSPGASPPAMASGAAEATTTTDSNVNTNANMNAPAPLPHGKRHRPSLSSADERGGNATSLRGGGGATKKLKIKSERGTSGMSNPKRHSLCAADEDDETGTQASGTTTITHSTMRSHHNMTTVRQVTFPEQLVDMLNNEEANSGTFSKTVVWTPDGKAFQVRNSDAFCLHVVPKYFPPCKFDSFVRKLYRWGFRYHKVELNGSDGADTDADEDEMMPQRHISIQFYHKYFRRDDRRLCLRMRSTVAPRGKKKAEAVAESAASSRGPAPANHGGRDVGSKVEDTDRDDGQQEDSSPARPSICREETPPAAAPAPLASHPMAPGLAPGVEALASPAIASAVTATSLVPSLPGGALPVPEQQTTRALSGPPAPQHGLQQAMAASAHHVHQEALAALRLLGEQQQAAARRQTNQVVETIVRAMTWHAQQQPQQQESQLVETIRRAVGGAMQERTMEQSSATEALVASIIGGGDGSGSARQQGRGGDLLPQARQPLQQQPVHQQPVQQAHARDRSLLQSLQQPQVEQLGQQAFQQQQALDQAQPAERTAQRNSAPEAVGQAMNSSDWGQGEGRPQVQQPWQVQQTWQSLQQQPVLIQPQQLVAQLQQGSALEAAAQASCGVGHGQGENLPQALQSVQEQQAQAQGQALLQSLQQPQVEQLAQQALHQQQALIQAQPAERTAQQNSAPEAVGQAMSGSDQGQGEGRPQVQQPWQQPQVQQARAQASLQSSQQQEVQTQARQSLQQQPVFVQLQQPAAQPQQDSAAEAAAHARCGVGQGQGENVPQALQSLQEQQAQTQAQALLQSLQQQQAEQLTQQALQQQQALIQAQQPVSQQELQQQVRVHAQGNDQDQQAATQSNHLLETLRQFQVEQAAASNGAAAATSMAILRMTFPHLFQR